MALDDRDDCFQHLNQSDFGTRLKAGTKGWAPRRPPELLRAIPLDRQYRRHRAVSGASVIRSQGASITVSCRSRGGAGREEIGNEKICFIAGVGVGVGGDSVVARPSSPSSSSFRFRETRCWRLRWIGLHWRFFRHPSRRMQPRLRSFDNTFRTAD